MSPLKIDNIIRRDRCTRCGGNMVKDIDGGPVCLLCGHSPEPIRPSDEMPASIGYTPPPEKAPVEKMCCYMCEKETKKTPKNMWINSAHFGKSRWYHNSIEYHCQIILDFYVCPDCQGSRGRGLQKVWEKVHEQVRLITGRQEQIREVTTKESPREESGQPIAGASD